MQEQDLKTIEIIAKEYFDKANGNIYFSARVTLNYGLSDEVTLYLPFQYGYGEHYINMAKKEIAKYFVIDKNDSPEAFFISLYVYNVVLRTNKEDNCKKRDVEDFGKA